MVEQKRPKIYGISENGNEYDRYKTLLDNSLSEALKENSIEKRLSLMLYLKINSSGK